MAKRNIYKHSIDLKTLKLKNAERNEFTAHLVEIPYRGYFVFIYNPSEQFLWQTTHKQVFEDLKQKAAADRKATIDILRALEKVYNGEDPDDVFEAVCLSNPIGENPEALLKVYKWIWGQEDVNYPTGQGRNMSWENMKLLMQKLIDQQEESQ